MLTLGGQVYLPTTNQTFDVQNFVEQLFLKKDLLYDVKWGLFNLLEEKVSSQE
jgi:hypothetical protein